MKWRFLDLEVRNAYENMATDEAIMEAVRTEDAPPTIRFYRWKPSAVSIGVQQKLNENVDVDECEKCGIDYVRRISGGGTVFHDSHGEITYSVIVPEEYVPNGIRERFELICGWIIRSLEQLGLHAEFEPINDVTVKGKKISGSAQIQRRGMILQHGTILYDMDLDLMFSVITVQEEKLAKKQLTKASERVTSITSHLDVTRSDVVEALKQGFLEDKTYEIGQLTEKERKNAETLVETKYSTVDWNHKR
ncbi:MAG: lipoate--protein ligase family protein [Candidatus Thorarchaeota archaeon]|nr:lipoate--protein ligase family protein [Candidatus Thorarchaeota archaeon]